jgi:DNA repair exonuclease SbcCD ATPase subunit
MNVLRRMTIFASLLGTLALCGCNAEVSELKEKMVTMEKRLAKQEKMLADFDKKFSVPKDFSVDIQRLEDQQEKVSELIKNKVEPVNKNMEEVRDWIQEADANRRKVTEKLKEIALIQTQIGGAVETAKREMERLGKELSDSSTKGLRSAKAIQDMEKTVKNLEATLQHNNKQILDWVKKTIPLVKDAAVKEIKGELDQLAKRIQQVQTGGDQDHKTPPEGLHPPIAAAPAGDRNDIKALRNRVKDLEDIVSQQKANLLDVGYKVHDLQMRLRRQAADIEDPTPTRPNRIERQRVEN